MWDYVCKTEGQKYQYNIAIAVVFDCLWSPLSCCKYSTNGTWKTPEEVLTYRILNSTWFKFCPPLFLKDSICPPEFISRNNPCNWNSHSNLLRRLIGSSCFSANAFNVHSMWTCKINLIINAYYFGCVDRPTHVSILEGLLGSSWQFLYHYSVFYSEFNG